MQLFCGKKIILRIFSYIFSPNFELLYNSELPNIPSMQNWVLLILILNAGNARFSKFGLKM